MSDLLRKQAVNEEIDYVFLKSALSQYAYPRDKITALLRNGDLIRVKKGLYVFGPDLAQGPYSKETLANLIYGPSAISLEYALAFYGLIPERVDVITSITSKRNKAFDTPIGRFSYRYIHPHKYPVGINQIDLDPTHSILIASPEKALADQLVLTRPTLRIGRQQELAQHLFDNLRIPQDALLSLDIMLFKEIALAYQHPLIDLLIVLLNDLLESRGVK